MIGPELFTADERLRLIAPDVARDASRMSEWLSGDQGVETLRSMGIAEKDILPPDIQSIEERMQHLIDSHVHVAWMIEIEGDIEGTMTVELQLSEYLDAPSVAIMIGDPWMRGKGLGAASLHLAIDYLHAEYEDIFVYARHRTSNEAFAQLLMKLGFEDNGSPYTDGGIVWQNVVLRNQD